MIVSPVPVHWLTRALALAVCGARACLLACLLIHISHSAPLVDVGALSLWHSPPQCYCSQWPSAVYLQVAHTHTMQVEQTIRREQHNDEWICSQVARCSLWNVKNSVCALLKNTSTRTKSLGDACGHCACSSSYITQHKVESFACTDLLRTVRLISAVQCSALCVVLRVSRRAHRAALCVCVRAMPSV